MVTNDRDNCQKARAEGIQAMTIFEYIRELGDADLLDTLSVEREEYDLKSTSGCKAIYSEHWSEEQIAEARKSSSSDSRRVFQGIMRQSPDNWLEAIVPLNNPIDLENGTTCDEIFLCGRIAMNRAIDGDIVLVELMPSSSWSSRSNVYVDADMPEEEMLAFESSDAKGKRFGSAGDCVPSGRVVAVLKRNWRPYVGTLEPTSETSAALVSQEDLRRPHQLIFVPLDRRVPKIKLVSRQYDVLKSQRVVVSIDEWHANSLLPHGHYVRALGKIGDKVVEAEALLQQHDLHLRPFSAKIMAELPDKDVPIVPGGGRLDLRSELICSIDPPGCTDIDDALHVRLLDNGNYQLGVHIADVSHYVKEGSYMDREARKRGNTIYLVDRRIDMLPRELGEDLCSINSNVDRYAFSVLWEVTPPNEEPQDDGSEDGFGVRVVDVSFHKTIIRSCANLSYGEAQFRIDDAAQTDALTTNLRVLNRIAKVLKRRRIAAGALSLASPQVRFVKDESSQDPIDVEMYESKEANSLVEEFMLLANIAVAAQITKFFPAFALLRRHPPPNQSKFDALIASMKRFNVQLDTSSSKRLSESLEENTKSTSTSDPFFNTLLRIMVTRCMNTARYFSSGTLVPSQFHHYGLAAPIYTHFTSPIRRYADVVVHRLLAASINYEGLIGNLNAKEVQRTSDIINRRHRMAEYAGRDSVRYHTIQFFRGKVMPTQTAYVLGLAANGFDILVPAYGIEGKVYIGGKGAIEGVSDMNGWTYSTHDQRLLHKETGKEIRIFDSVQVELSVDDQKPHALKLAFRCISPALHESFSIVPLIHDKEEKDNIEGDNTANNGAAGANPKKRKSTGSTNTTNVNNIINIESEPKAKKPKKK